MERHACKASVILLSFLKYNCPFFSEITVRTYMQYALSSPPEVTLDYLSLCLSGCLVSYWFEINHKLFVIHQQIFFTCTERCIALKHWVAQRSQHTHETGSTFAFCDLWKIWHFSDKSECLLLLKYYANK